MDYSSLFQRMVKAYGLASKGFPDGFAFGPLQVFAEVTYQCNLRCGFCQFLQCERLPGREEMGADAFARILSQMRKGGIISFTGGEPFVKPGFFRLLAEMSRDHRTHVFTNGTLIHDEMAARLVGLGASSLFANGLVLIAISLEGLEETHDRIVKSPLAFERTLGAVEALVKQKRKTRKKYPLIEVKAVISEENVHDMYALFSLAKGCGADIFNPMAISMVPHADRMSGAYGSPFNPLPAVREVDPKVLKGQLDRIRKEAKGIQLRTTPQGLHFNELLGYYQKRFSLKDYTCYFPWYGATITAYGDVLICPYMKVGHVSEGSIGRLRNRGRARDFRKKLKKQEIFPGCLGCCCLTKK